MTINKSSSNYLNEAKMAEKKNREKEARNSSDDIFVDEVKFKSKVPKKPDEEFYVSKINKPAKIKDDPNFFQSLMFQFSKDNTSGMAAQLAYDFLLAVFPLLIFLFTLEPLFQNDKVTIKQLNKYYVPSECAGTLEWIIGNVMTASSGDPFSVGLIVTQRSASKCMIALVNAFNVEYAIEDN